MAFAVFLLATAAVPVLAAENPSPGNVVLPPTPDEFDPELLPRAEDITAGIEAAEENEEERKAWLESSAAVTERQASRFAYAGLDAVAAEHLLTTTFGAQLAQLNGDPARVLSDAQLVSSSEETSATIKDEGDGQVLESSLPVRAESEDGDLRKVDVSLEETSDGFETENALVDVTIPESAADPIEVGEGGIAIKLAGAAEDRLAQPFGDQNVFAPSVLPDTDMLVSPIATGVEIFNLLRSENSPEVLRFMVQMPAAAELRADGEWGAEIVKDGEVLSTIREPVAVDAQGSNVPVDLWVEGNSLVLTVNHREADYAMPIMVDPILENDENWIYGQNHNALDMGVWGFNKNVAGMYGSTYCIYECFGPGGSGTRGLFVSAQNGTYWPNQFAQWSYSAPNIHSYVKDVTLGAPYVHADHNCSEQDYPQPHNYFGIWSANLNNWVYLSVNSANQPGSTYTLPFSGDSAIFGLGTGAKEYSIGCWRDLYTGGAHVWLDDWNPPWVESVSGLPSSWINATTPVNITAKAADQGLGVQNAIISPEAAPIVYDVPVQSQCSGTRRNLCWTGYTANFADNGLTGASFREGIRPAYLNVYDATGKYASAYNFQTKVDAGAPEVTLEGQLAEATNEVGSVEKPAGTGDELSLPVYNLKIEAKDGTNESNLTKRSGVKDIEIWLDGAEQEVPWTPTASCVSSCAMTKTYPLKLSRLDTAGKHTLKVKVLDFAGNKRERDVEFEYFPATGMKDEYVMQYFPLPDGTGNEAEEEHPQRPELAVNVMNGNLVYRETDVDVEGTAALDLEVERYYNSMLPTADNSEWGDGWTLAQTPDLEPIKAGGSSVPNEAEVLDSSGVIEGGVVLPTAAGTSKFDPTLQATVTKKASGGYEMTDETGESPGSISFDATGQAEALLSDGYAKVDYGYEGGKLTDIEVSDPSTFSADPSELEIPDPELITKPTYASSFGSLGSSNGQLKAPGDVAVDMQGNLWVVDKSNNRVQKFDPTGKFLTKFGTYGSADGQFNRPTAIAIAGNGDLLITDAGNRRVERFNSAGVFLSKFGSVGTGNGQFAGSGPEGIALDSGGNVWVSDTYGGRLQKFSSAGAFLQSVGTKGSGAGQLGEPTGIDIAPSGDIWVADWQNHRITKFNSAGTFLGSFGSNGTGDGQFNNPDEIEIDKLGNVWIGDQSNNRIQQFDLNGQFKGKFGTAGSSQGQFSFSYPMGIAADSKGHLWVADVNNNRIQQWLVPIERPAYMSAFGSMGSGDGQLQAPGDVVVGIEGNLWVADKSNNRLQKFDSTGKFLGKVGAYGTGDGQFNRPTGIAIDRDGNLLVADANNNRIEKFSPEGQFLSKFGTAGTGNGEFSIPEGVAADLQGNIWVADSGNGRIQKFDEEGKFLAVVSAKGTGSGQIGKPIGIDIAPDGSIWVGDLQNHRVSVFKPDGSFVREFGSLGSGPGQFNRPSALEVDNRGNVWVGDQSNHRVQRFDLGGNYISQFGSFGSGEGQFSFPTANTPVGIATDGRGGILVTDVNNQRIQRWQIGNYLTATPAPLDLTDGDAKVDVKTSAGLVSSVTGNAAGTHTYVHSGDDLTAYSGPEGETTYQYNTGGQMTKVTLPNGTYGSIVYQADGRVKSVTVYKAGSASARTTEFVYQDSPTRRTTVIFPDAPHVTYDIGADGSVLKWWNTAKPPTIEPLTGNLYDNRETSSPISAGDYILTAKAWDAEGIASINVVVNGNQLVDEWKCPEQKPLACVEPVPVNEWVMETGDFVPGILNVEVLVTDQTGESAAQRFWVNVPQPPPPSLGAPVPPKFKEIKKFREEYGLEVVFPVANEIELNERIFNLIGAWNNPNSPAGEVARASWERWGVPLRPEDVAELEYREWLLEVDSSRIAEWVETAHPDTYAGYYMDHEAGGILHIGFTSNQATELEALENALSLVGVERLQPYANTPSVPFEKVQGVSEDVASAVDSDAALASKVLSVSDDEAGGTVYVGTQHVSEVDTRLISQFGAGAPIDVNYVSGGKLFSGRFRNEGRIRSGDNLLNTYGPCTAGFGAYQKLDIGGEEVVRNFILSAGHCWYLDETVSRSPYSDGSHPDEWREVGDVHRKAWPSEEAVSTDALAIRTNGDIVPRGIFGWGGDLIPTQPASRARVGNMVCYSGAATQNPPRCGKIVAREKHYLASPEPGLPTEPEGGYWVQFNPDTYPTFGDSGAPVWNRRTEASIGLITAGRESFQALVEPLLHPPNMNPEHLPGILHNIYLAPLSLKLGG